MSKLPLEGITVLELASVLAGPSVGQFLAELGAEVIKIENRKTKGDVTRGWLSKNEDPEVGISAYFASVNWGKRSVALDLSEKEGQSIIHQLAASADIVLTSFKLGDDKKLGVDYQSLKRINNKIIYGHITGYGLKSKRAGYDAIIQAETGFMYMNGVPGGESIKMPVALVDILAAHHLKEGILIALLRRMSTKTGSYVHVSLFDAAVASLANQGSNWLVAGQVPQKMGAEHPNIAPYGRYFRTKDGALILLAIGSDKQFKTLCELIDEVDLAIDPRFLTNQSRVQNKDALYPVLELAFDKLDSRKIAWLLEENSIPYGFINDLSQVFETDLAKNMLLQAPGSSLLGVRNNAFEFDQSGIKPSLPEPPKYGEHSREILSEKLQMGSSEISDLFRKGIVE